MKCLLLQDGVPDGVEDLQADADDGGPRQGAGGGGRLPLGVAGAPRLGARTQPGGRSPAGTHPHPQSRLGVHHSQRCHEARTASRGTGIGALNTEYYISRSITVSGAGRSSEVERSLMVWWVVGSILHEVDPLSYFSFQPVLHDWGNKGRGMCYPVCGIVHIQEPLLLIDKSSLCGGSGFPFSLSEWSLTICLTPYNCG